MTKSQCKDTRIVTLTGEKHPGSCKIMNIKTNSRVLLQRMENRTQNQTHVSSGDRQYCQSKGQLSFYQKPDELTQGGGKTPWIKK